MSRVEVLADESTAPRATRSRPSFAGIRWDTSSAGTVLTCSGCIWRSGPHGTEELAVPFARAHSNICAQPENRKRHTRSLGSTA